MESTKNYYDNLIIGAGLSGIAAAHRLQTELPHKTFKILEGRDSIGGTWDLFRYPGIRSDSDMYTLGYSFSPWYGKKTLADGQSILSYIKSTASKYRLEEHIQLSTEVKSIKWYSDKSLWIVNCINSKTKESIIYSCRFIFLCTGYYDYSQGYTPQFKDQEKFTGTIIHPQFWPERYDPTNKRIIVIGSGATAITLVPELAKKASHVIMLQRSPTYILPLPDIDHLSNFIMDIFPSSIGHFINRVKNIFFMNLMYILCQFLPTLMKTILLGIVKLFLGPSYNIDTHFTPYYKPWDERLCIVPDGDLFKSIKSGNVTVKTGEILNWNEQGIQIKNREKNNEPELLKCDTIITATGLVIKLGGGIQIFVDDKEIESLSHHFMYKGIMISDIPNLVMAIGYTNQSFTLKVDLISKYIVRVWKYMDTHHYTSFRPVYTSKDDGEPLLNLTSGYIKRAIDKWPKQGKMSPWKYYQNYLYDIFEFYYGQVNDGVMVFK